ncbi:hypothetical protein [Streptomyces sp. NPDC087272]|uniref:hypothetical protein n=1 Tax=Streptomyces sp. NPDC087272 TaxID=3365775 RepID=UPI0038003165
MQPQLVDRTRERADKATARAYARDGLPAPEVTIVDLRRQSVHPQDQDPDEGEGAHGPDHAMRRQTWTPSYVKGPEGAPLLSAEKVNVWRR